MLFYLVKGTMRIQSFRESNVLFFGIFSRIFVAIKQNPMVTSFFVAHLVFAIFLGRLFALAPDENGYIFTFDHVYVLPISTAAQTSSGWITAPTIFLWIAYLPAKILNMLGVPAYLSLRILSVALVTISLFLLKGVLGRSNIKENASRKLIFFSFLIPSVFLWTSVGMRESFIIVETTIFLIGMNYLFHGKGILGVVLLSLASYGLVSTKNYLWACLMVALILSSICFVLLGINRKMIARLLLAGLLIPTLLYVVTTSAYSFDFIRHSDISGVGARSGDSISQIYVDVPKKETGAGTETGTETETELVSFRGDYTLIALHFYLIDNPHSLISKVFALLHFDEKIETIWDEKVKSGLINKDKQVGTDTSSLNGRILEPAKITNPLSLLVPAFIFLCGPFPFIGNPGIAVGIASLESPLWWGFYAIVIFQFIRFRKIKFLRDPQILFTLIFLVGEIAFSALVEVNLGTSFRHRSILLVPLVFLYVRLAQRAKE